MGIEVKGVSKRFPLHDGRSQILVLDNVSVAIADNEFICLLGPSGCGKSTLLKIVAGFTKQDSGTIEVDGFPIDGPSPQRAMVFQDFALFPWLTVEQNVLFGLQLAGKSEEELKEASARFIAMVGLNGFEKAYPHQLSGGMKQRVGIARILAISPRILLMDEPFGALDAFTRMEMQEELVNIWKRDSHTTVFVTHDVDEAVYLADRIVVMSSRPGKIKTIVSVPLARPRQRTDGDFVSIRNHVLKQYERTSSPVPEFSI